MDFSLSAEEAAIAEVVRDFTRKELNPIELRIDQEGAIDPNEYRRLRLKAAELGMLGVDFPEDYGGAGLGVLAYTLVREELGATSQALRFVVTAGPAKMLMAGTEEQRRKYMVPVIEGRYVAAFAVTEPAAGADPAGMETLARRDGNSWVLNGSKHYISNGPSADFVIVFAVTDREKRAHGGISAFIVEKGTPGFHAGKMQQFMGWRGVPQGELVFEDCGVSEQNMLGPEGAGFKTVMSFLDQGRLGVAATCVGCAQHCLDMAVAYAKDRRTFGVPLAERQAVQWMVADSMVEIHAARLMVREAAAKMDAGRRITTEAAMCKLFATEMAMRVVDRCMQIHGGAGMTKDLPLELHYRDLRLHKIGEGPSEIQRLIISRAAFHA